MSDSKRTVKLTAWQIAAIEVAVREKAPKMASQDDWKNLVRALEGCTEVRLAY